MKQYFKLVPTFDEILSQEENLFRIYSIEIGQSNRCLDNIYSYDELMKCISDNPKMYIKRWQFPYDYCNNMSFFTGLLIPGEMHLNTNQFYVSNTIAEIK